MNRIKSFFTATLLATAIGIGSITAIPVSSASAQSLLGVTPGDIQSYFVCQNLSTGQLTVSATVPQGYRVILGPVPYAKAAAYYNSLVGR